MSTSFRTGQEQEKKEKENKELQEKLEKQKEELRKESVSMSVIGTTIPSKLFYAPTLWLITLFCWLSYFSVQRAAVQRNLAAYHLSLSEPERAFGKVGDGSIWIVPLPSVFTLPFSSVCRADILQILGWTERTHLRLRKLLCGFALFGLAPVTRMVWIAHEMSLQTAVKLEVTPEEWRNLILAPTVFLAILCFSQIWNLLLRANHKNVSPDLPLISRREAIIGTVAFLAALTSWRFREPISVILQRRSGYFFGEPRYISPKNKMLRRANHRVFKKTGFKSVLVRSDHGTKKIRSSRRGGFTAHFADKDGLVRLFSKARGNPSFIEIAVDQLKKLQGPASNTESKTRTKTGRTPLDHPRLNADNLLAFELIALSHIEKNELKEACEYLLTAVRHHLTTIPKRSVNLRLLDLLAGLAVRSGLRKDYLEPLIQIVDKYVAQLGERAKQKAAAALKDRVAKWRDQKNKWHKRWTAKTCPVWWHHPLALRDFKWERTVRMKHPPANPEKRQQPILIP